MPENYDIPPIISLHRYFCAVARMQKEYERVLQSPEHEEKRKTLKPDMFAIYLHSGPASVLYYWYGALCPVKEGYEKLGLRDARIDALLKSTANIEALKRCRNGAFHFQKDYFDERFLGPMREPDFVQWVRDFTEAFRVCIEKELAQAPWVENSQNGKNRTLVRREIDKE
jgi:hypothetical protein